MPKNNTANNSSDDDGYNNVSVVDFTEALGERYLSYALSTIMSRSLPDVRDGLKPVHRRLLYAMQQLKLDPKSGYKKCARIVGDVIGKYHPHGEVAVYDSLVRLAQNFTLRYPLIDGQGNFGSIDGDNAAAMRYTESRLTDVAQKLIEDLDKNTVNFRPTYDGLDEEPVILPANFPNLLANGSEGIAVGMACSVLPHNLDEICEALKLLIKNPTCTVKELVEVMPGPDFPTGGIIVEDKNTILKAYETGRGSFRVRAKWHKEELSHGQYQIVITEIPYQVQKSKMVEKMAAAFKDKKLILVDNIRDESTEEMRLIIDPKNRLVDPQLLVESLYKITDLEVRISSNMNVLGADNVPRVMNLKQILEAFLTHRLEVINRRSNYRLQQIKHRLEILEGLLIAYLNLDEVINIIREEDEPKIIMQEKWQLTDIQVEAILNIRLRSLRKLEEMEIKREATNLSEEKNELEKLIAQPELQFKLINKDLTDLKNKFGKNTELGKRRTEFGAAIEFKAASSIEAFIEKEPITIIYSRMGWIKAVKSHNININELKYKDGDEASLSLQVYTTDKILFMSSAGKFYTLLADKITRGKSTGEPMRLLIDMDNTEHLIHMMAYEPHKKVIIASSNSKGFIAVHDDLLAQTKSGKQVLTPASGSEACLCRDVEGDHVAIIGENRKLLLFSLKEVTAMKRGQGLTLQSYKQGKMSDLKTFELEKGLTWQGIKKPIAAKELTMWLGHRAQAGKLAPRGFPVNNKFGDNNIISEK